MQKKGTEAIIPSPEERQEGSTLSGVVAIKVTISWTLLIRVDNKTMSHWERCFNIAWSTFFFFIYNYIFYTEILCACDQSGSELTHVWIYDNGCVWAKKTPQSFSQRAGAAATPLGSAAGAEGTAGSSAQPSMNYSKAGPGNKPFPPLFIPFSVAGVPCSPLAKAPWQFPILLSGEAGIAAQPTWDWLCP